MKKIAIPLKSSNLIDDHFGHCKYYGIYTISDQNQVVGNKILESEQGCGCKSNIAQELHESGVSVMLAGGIGLGAINVLNSHQIEVVRGCSGNAEDIIQQYIDGKLIDNGVNCNHHEEGHQCSH